MKKFILFFFILFLTSNSYAQFGGAFGTVQSSSQSSWNYVTKTIAFDGGTTNDPGDFDGTGNPAILFDVTGMVEVKCFADCTEDLVGTSAALDFYSGIISETGNSLGSQNQTATDLDSGEVFYRANTGATLFATDEIASSIGTFTLESGRNIYQRIDTANVTDGTIIYRCQWRKFDSDGNVTAAP